MKKTISILLLLLISLQISYAQCNGSLDLCSKQYNEVAYLTTHNAFNSDQDVLAVVDQLNGFTSTSSINISEQNPERKLIIIKDMLARETEVKNNSILFYLYDDGTLEKKIIVK